MGGLYWDLKTFVRKTSENGELMNIEKQKDNLNDTDEPYEVINTFEVVELYGLNNQLAKARIGSKWMIVDRDFRVISRKDYDQIGRAIGDMIIAEKDGGYTFINSKGEEICPPYDNVWAFNKGLALVKKNGEMFFINKEGTRISPVFDHICQYGNHQRTTIKGSAKEVFESDEDVRPFKSWIGDYAIIIVGDKQGVINRKGKIVVPVHYDLVSIDRVKRSNYISVSIDGKWGYVDKRTGEEVTDIVYDPICQYTRLTSHTKLSIDGKYGLIDKRGRQLCPFIYDQIGTFIDGCAVVRIGVKFGYMRYDDCSLICELRYSSAYPFISGYGEVSEKGLFGYKKRYVDASGRVFRKPPK